MPTSAIARSPFSFFFCFLSFCLFVCLFVCSSFLFLLPSSLSVPFRLRRARARPASPFFFLFFFFFFSLFRSFSLFLLSSPALHASVDTSSLRHSVAKPSETPHPRDTELKMAEFYSPIANGRASEARY